MDSQTHRVCEHVSNTVRHNSIGNIYAVDSETGKARLLKRGQRIGKRGYGHPYWVLTGHRLVQIGKDKYMLPTR